MTDITLITSTLNGITSAIDIAKSIKNAGSSLEAATFKVELAELMCALADSKSQIAEIKNLIIEKDEHIELLEKKLKAMLSNEKPEYKKGFYKFENDDSNYCTRCWDDGMKKFRLTKTVVPNFVQCVQCKTTVSIL